jgi:hypothetical protein
MLSSGSVPDDDRTRRPRVGDETKERIDNLASGWSVGETPPADLSKVEATPASSEVGAPPRKKQKTLPPPPPGSAERVRLEQAIVQANPTPQPTKADASAKSPAPKLAPPRPNKPTTPPPPLPPRAKPQSVPPPIPTAALAPPPAPLPPPPAVPPRATAVPVGEFDAGATNVDENKLRIQYAQETIKRDAAEALLQIAGAPPPLVGSGAPRTDPTGIDSGTSPFERGDPTTMQRPDQSPFATEQPTVGGTIRPAAALRRKRGIAGDVRYVFTALFGVRRSRRELVALERAQDQRAQSRRRHVVTLGRTAVTADAFDHPALVKARERLQAVEDERSQHAGQVAAADAELERVRRDRDARVKQHDDATKAIAVELAELARKLEPLDRDAVGAKRRATELKDQIARIADKIAAAEARLVSVKGQREDRAAIDAEIATLKADRIAVSRDEPKIAAELDALYPRIAAIEAARADARKRQAELDRAEAEDQRRCAELRDAIGAKRKVVERAAADAEAMRDRVLFELGERLCVDRPPILGAQLSPIDAIELEMGDADRRVMELREVLSNVDKAKIARGVAMIAAVVLVVGGVVAWLALR